MLDKSMEPRALHTAQMIVIDYCLVGLARRGAQRRAIYIIIPVEATLFSAARRGVCQRMHDCRERLASELVVRTLM